MTVFFISFLCFVGFKLADFTEVYKVTVIKGYGYIIYINNALDKINLTDFKERLRKEKIYFSPKSRAYTIYFNEFGKPL